MVPATIVVSFVICGVSLLGAERYDIVAKVPEDSNPPADPSKLTDVQRKTFMEKRQAMLQGLLAGSQTGMANLIQALSQIMRRTIVDQTGLTGKYDFELKWTPDQSSSRGFLGEATPLGPPPGVEAPPPPDPNGPTVFTALQEQLGLKLDSGKGPVEVIVIDHAEKASAN
jgi:hypothetical protein